MMIIQFGIHKNGYYKNRLHPHELDIKDNQPLWEENLNIDTKY